MRDFGFFGVKKDERKLPNERGWYGVWDDPKDVELEKQKRNLGTEDGVGSEYTKMIKLFILKVDYHISYCWVFENAIMLDGNPKVQLSL